MRIGLVGMGNLGSAVANLIANNGFEVVGWEFSPDVREEINRDHVNTKYLPGIDLHHDVAATADMGKMLEESDMVFLAIPSIFIQPTLLDFQDRLPAESVIVNMAKGISAETGLTAYQTVASLFPSNPKVMLSGPSIASEFAREMPTVVVLASENHDHLLKVAHVLDGDCFRTRFSDDVIGVELGGVLKNIYSIGLGMLDGKDIRSVNFRAVYLTIALEEMTKIGVAMGAKIETFLYLSGMGDLLATSMSQHSHNRRMGEYLAQELPLDAITERMGVLPEGYNTLQVILYIAEKLHVSIPLAKGLWDVIHGRYEADRFITAFIRDFVE